MKQSFLTINTPNLEYEKLKNQINYKILDIYEQQSYNFHANNSKQDALYNIEVIPQYRHTNRLEMPKEKINRISDQLQIQLSARLSHQERVKNQEQFAQFTFNPISQIPQLSKKLKNYHRNKKQQSKNDISIFNAIQKSKQRTQINFLKKRLIKAEENMNNIYNKMGKRKTLLFPTNNKKEQLQQRHESTQIESIENNFAFLDNLVRRKDNKQFKINLHTKDANIFKLAMRKIDIKNCRQTLDGLYFCHDSIQHNPQNKQGANTFRQISHISRQFITSQHRFISMDNRLLSTDMMIKMDKLSYEEIMIVSSGVLQPRQLFLNLNDDNKKGKIEDEIISEYYKQQHIPIFTDHLENKKMSFFHPDNNLMQIQHYKNYPLTEKELKQKSLSIQLQQQLLIILQREKLMKAYRINDQQLNRQIKRQKDKIMKIQNGNIDAEEEDNDKKIRMSKLFKDRSENIRMGITQDSVIVVKKHDKTISRTSTKKKSNKHHLISMIANDGKQIKRTDNTRNVLFETQKNVPPTQKSIKQNQMLTKRSKNQKQNYLKASPLRNPIKIQQMSSMRGKFSTNRSPNRKSGSPYSQKHQRSISHSPPFLLYQHSPQKKKKTFWNP